jgi:hypothetical protein
MVFYAQEKYYFHLIYIYLCGKQFKEIISLADNRLEELSYLEYFPNDIYSEYLIYKFIAISKSARIKHFSR